VRRRRIVHTGDPAGPKVAARLLIVLGLAGYAINPLGYNLGLTVLDVSWVAVLLGVNNSLQVLIWSALLLRERPTRLQLGAIAVAMVAIVGFQMPDAGPDRWALAPTSAVIASGVGYALWIVGNRSLVSRMHPLDLACPSMLAGSVPVLLIGVATEGLPSLTAAQWLLVIVLAVVNTAAAFTVWTHTQRTLTAYQSAAINNTMTVQTALLAFVFLKEPLTAGQWIATIGIMSATLVIQLTGRTPSKASPRSTDTATRSASSPTQGSQ
jgi:drug/metabolite transporter (DMT)-like permease